MEEKLISGALAARSLKWLLQDIHGKNLGSFNKFMNQALYKKLYRISYGYGHTKTSSDTKSFV